MDRASTDNNPSMDKGSTDKTCRWILLTTNYPLISTGQCEDKMTENQKVQSGVDMTAGLEFVDPGGFLKTEAYLVHKPF